jgi:hypothetical protein
LIVCDLTARTEFSQAVCNAKDTPMSDAALIRNSEKLIDAYKRLIEAAEDDDRNQYNRVSVAVDRLVYRLVVTKPTTSDGLRAKAQAALVLLVGGEPAISTLDTPSALARSLLHDLAWLPESRSKVARQRPHLTVIEGGLQSRQ